MSGTDLVVTVAGLEAIETAMTSTHDELLERVSSLRSAVEAQVIGWQSGTASREAQVAFDRALATWVEDLGSALAGVTGALARVREAAHDAEVRNVAIMD